MKLEVNIDKRHALIIVIAIVLLGGTIFVLAQATPNPGHARDEIDVDLNCRGLSSGAFPYSVTCNTDEYMMGCRTTLNDGSGGECVQIYGGSTRGATCAAGCGGVGWRVNAVCCKLG